jgi:hypothetical protein
MQGLVCAKPRLFADGALRVDENAVISNRAVDLRSLAGKGSLEHAFLEFVLHAVLILKRIGFRIQTVKGFGHELRVKKVFFHGHGHGSRTQ